VPLSRVDDAELRCASIRSLIDASAAATRRRTGGNGTQRGSMPRNQKRLSRYIRQVGNAPMRATRPARGYARRRMQSPLSPVASPCRPLEVFAVAYDGIVAWYTRVCSADAEVLLVWKRHGSHKWRRRQRARHARRLLPGDALSPYGTGTTPAAREGSAARRCADMLITEVRATLVYSSYVAASVEECSCRIRFVTVQF